MHTRTNSRKLSLSVQNFKCSFDNFDNRQVQLQQVIAHCIVMLEALQPQSLAVPDLSDCERSESGCLLRNVQTCHAIVKKKLVSGLNQAVCRRREERQLWRGNAGWADQRHPFSAVWLQCLKSLQWLWRCKHNMLQDVAIARVALLRTLSSNCIWAYVVSNCVWAYAVYTQHCTLLLVCAHSMVLHSWR